MGISISPRLETELRTRAEAEGISLEAYIERLLRADEQAKSELASLAREGLDSGELIEAGADYWDDKHRRLEARLNDR